jgi:hypothetical protein
MSMPAQADLVISDLIFRDLGGTGFGVAPRLLTLQNNGFEEGGTVAGPGGTTLFSHGGSLCTATGAGSCPVHEPSTGANESLVYNVGALGWTSGALVGIGLDTNEIGSTAGLTFQTLVLTLYNSAGVALGSFSGDGPVFISQALLSFQQGNGNSVFDIRLDAAQQAQYDAILAANGGAANVFEGLSASFGCTSPAIGCGPSGIPGARPACGRWRSRAGCGMPGAVRLQPLPQEAAAGLSQGRTRSDEYPRAHCPRAIPQRGSR